MTNSTNTPSTAAGTPVRTRFAPSPTGFLHVGGARTALFNWLFARKHGGQFVVRIEDTDQVRSTAESAAGILSDLQWLGLDWDLGPVPGAGKNEYFQSMRLDIYRPYIDDLLNRGLAYEAWETPQQLAAMRMAAEKAKRPFRYRQNMPGRAPRGDGPCVIRFAMPWEEIRFVDEILGEIRVAGDEHDDIIIRKSDGFPTYHFAVVVDDHLMGITHVLRAQEHLMNTPKHLGLYAAFGWQPPRHAHMPLVFNMDNTKMSKRDKAKAARHALQLYARQKNDADFQKLAESLQPSAGVGSIPRVDNRAIVDFVAKKNDDTALAAVLAASIGVALPEIDVHDFRRSGYLADALLNFISLIGWSPGENREILSRAEMLDLFSLQTIGKTSGRFDRKKLQWMNGEYIRRTSVDGLVAAVRSFLQVVEYPLADADDVILRQIIAMYQERMATLAEMAENSRFFFTEPQIDRSAGEKFIARNAGHAALVQIRDLLLSAVLWNSESLSPIMEQIIALGEKRGAAAQALRVAVSGGAVSPPLLETLLLLGRDRTLARVDHALALFKADPPEPSQ